MSCAKASSPVSGEERAAIQNEFDRKNDPLNIKNRVFFRVIGLPFYRRLVLPFALFLFVVLQADAIINWVALRDQLAAASPWHVATLFTTLFTLWGVIAGGSLRPVWRQPAIAFLVRQPLSRWQWVRYLLPPLSIAFVPVFGIWWLAPHYLDAPIHYVAFVGLAWTTILGASFRGVAAAKWVATGIVATAVLILGYAYQPIVAFLAAIASVALLPLSVSEIRDQIARTDQVGDGNLASISPIIAIIRRDALCLWRVERKSLFRMIQLAIVVALLMLALRINGEVVGRETFELACGLLSLALLPTYDILTRLKSQLGLELMRRRWPLSHRQRAVALLGLSLGLAAPSLVALCLIGHSMGAMYIAHFILYAAVSLVVLSALFSQALLSTAVTLGWSLWALLIHTILALVLPPWTYVVLATFLVSMGSLFIVKGLREFTQLSEIRIHE